MSALLTPSPPTPAVLVDDDGGDYDYYWSRGGLEIRVPRWVAEIMEVRPSVGVEIFIGGVCTGLLLAAAALLFGFYLTL